MMGQTLLGKTQALLGQTLMGKHLNAMVRLHVPLHSTRGRTARQRRGTRRLQSPSHHQRPPQPTSCATGKDERKSSLHAVVGCRENKTKALETKIAQILNRIRHKAAEEEADLINTGPQEPLLDCISDARGTGQTETP